MSQDGRSAIVTGGGRGIGRAIALALAGQGCHVAILDLIEENAQSVKKEVEALGRRALALRVDLTQQSQVDQAVAKVLAEFGQIDILVNNAGWDKLEPFLESQPETWEKIIAINLKSVFYTAKAVLPHMVSRGSGKLVNIGSDAGRGGSTGEAVYAATKGGIIAFSKSLAREMARYKINVNVVCPGLTETPLLQEVRDTSEKAHKVVDAITRAIPLGRVGAPEDIANAVAYLASPAADYVTGQTLSVSGGLTMF
ncbi:MAG: glucose 1-dehydrogenase [Acidobacteria bacterium]|nr:glucose 1-dehydrogenase [Acidobacteriota bacterium]